MKKNVVLVIMGMIIGLTGFALAFIWYDWRLALIIVLVGWGNNLEQKYTR